MSALELSSTDAGPVPQNTVRPIPAYTVEVRALDATGLRAILEASRRSAGNGNRLRVTRGSDYVADLFRLTALDHTIQFDDVSSGDLEA